MGSTTRRRARGEAWLAVALLCAPSSAAQDGSVLETALHFFTRQDAARVVERLDIARPAPVSQAERLAALATLPPKGEIRDLDDGQRRKLAAARWLLELHGRDAVYELKVVDVPQAAVALYARSVLVVSRAALDLLDASELQALVAHEVGHEYFWREYYEARGDDDRRRLRTLELLCDGLAIVTLRRAGMEAARLTSALDKVLRYNRHRFGAALNEDHYPAIGVRRDFARRLVGWLERSRQP